MAFQIVDVFATLSNLSHGAHHSIATEFSSDCLSLSITCIARRVFLNKETGQENVQLPTQVPSAARLVHAPVMDPENKRMDSHGGMFGQSLWY